MTRTDTSGNMGVERLRFRAIAEVEHLIACASFHVRGWTGTRQYKASKEQAKNTIRPHVGKVIHKARRGKPGITGRDRATGPERAEAQAPREIVHQPTRLRCAAWLPARGFPPAERRAFEGSE